MSDMCWYTTKTAQKAACYADAFRRALMAVLAAVVMSAAIVDTASAHPILVPRPTQTLADRLLESDSVILAREDPQRPFHYAVVDTLKGDPGTTPIDLLMPSHVRRQLASDPELAILLRRVPKTGEWETLGIANGDYMQVVRRILAFADVWTPNETDNPQRLQEFAALLGHRDARLHELAYLEIGRATYASIRRVGADVPLERVRAMLNDPFFFEWRGLDIMLLGLSDEKQDQSWVIREMQQRQSQSSSLNLAAWATAYLEIQGTVGIDQLVQWYFRDARRSRDELRPVTRALAGHANYDPEWRQPVVAAYRVMLETHPYAAPDIAHDLIAWKHWDLAEQLQQLKSQLTMSDPLGAYKIDLYLQRAMMHGRLLNRH